MKTTLIIDDGVMLRLREEAARQGRTMSELVEAGLRLLLFSRPPSTKVPPLPSFRMGRPRVDVSSREALFSAMEEGD